ncbi:hypothetical protein NEMBOFW57_008428 [Staphylotrichum longicolle]|uniref:Uncharacterized protein n=1 Tax=Staphylotrichum longicolle TaxID=669026 RepID=A0AAD4HX72_9PEZI|nr:hypothetical protein NEMBOFW57_008428 [Staphylotrichum longicolle]
MPEDSGHSGPEASGAMSDSENEYDETDLLVKDEDERMADPSGASEGADTSGRRLGGLALLVNEPTSLAGMRGHASGASNAG